MNSTLELITGNITEARADVLVCPQGKPEPVRVLPASDESATTECYLNRFLHVSGSSSLTAYNEGTSRTVLGSIVGDWNGYNGFHVPAQGFLAQSVIYCQIVGISGDERSRIMHAALASVPLSSITRGVPVDLESLTLAERRAEETELRRRELSAYSLDVPSRANSSDGSLISGLSSPSPAQQPQKKLNPQTIMYHTSEATTLCLDFATRLGYASIALPLFGRGCACVDFTEPLETSAQLMIDAIFRYDAPSPLHVSLVAENQEQYAALQLALERAASQRV